MEKTYFLLGKPISENTDDLFKRMLADTNANQIIKSIKKHAKNYEINKFFEDFPEDEKTVEFRRQISSDFFDENVFDIFDRFTDFMFKANKFEKKISQFGNDLQNYKFHTDALFNYIKGIETLLELDALSKEHSKALCELINIVKNYQSSNIFQTTKTLILEVYDYFDSYRTLLTVKPENVSIVIPNKENNENRDFISKYEKVFSFLTNSTSSGRYESGLTNDSLSNLEIFITNSIKKSNPDVYEKLKKLFEFKMDSFYFQIEHESIVYLAYFKYINYFIKKGYTFSIPKKGSLNICDGYDLALCELNSKEDKAVVPNNFYLTDNERFAVITGPNGGGKTTLARMVGLVIFLGRMGLPVPANKASIPHYSTILTHFSVEESNESGKGKLMEELTRLKPILSTKAKNPFVILNELFTTAATLDATEMGKKIMDFFTKKSTDEINSVHHGIYVTHIQALARESETVVSMIATLMDDHKTRSYKIVRKPACEEEYENSMIEKHKLTYEKLKEVLENE